MSKDVYMKECPQDVITVLQQMEQQKVEIAQKNNVIQQLSKENEQIKIQTVTNVNV